MQGRIRTRRQNGFRSRRSSELCFVSVFAVVAITFALRTSSRAQITPAPPTAVDQLKARVASTALNERPRLCVEIAEKQLKETDRLYSASDLPGAQAALTDVVAYSELARDYSIQTHKYQKQAEIAVRGMTRKLNEIKHSLGHDDQAPIQDALNRLERVRDDLLASLFKRGGK